MASKTCRRLILILGDQLDASHAALEQSDPDRDRVLMIECNEESTHVWTHKHRITLFLSAMRHFAKGLDDKGWPLTYRKLEDDVASIAAGLDDAIDEFSPEAIWMVLPGEWRVLDDVRSTAEQRNVTLEVLDDDHFMVTPDAFAEWADGRKQLTLEYFYRELRKKHDILMDDGDPAGGEWNFDKENRKSFPKSGPKDLPAIPRFEPDEITANVIDAVNERFGDHPGELADFAWPVTREQAVDALDAFIEQRLPLYGRFQDAMWQGEPFLYHALIASALNLKLLNPREVIDAAIFAWERDGDRYPIAAIEGFVRQILGWREFIRGVYWLEMPDYKALNHFGHEHDLPEWFWTGDSDMNCMRQAIGDTLANGYAHHIQRLMVIGNYATLAELNPQQVCDWYLAVYVDAVEWVELPNTLGMALHGDGGIVGSKPYVSSGNYINKMSNYCGDCKFSISKRSGENACPFNAMYWDFLNKHRKALSTTPRMRMVLKNLDRWDDDEIKAISKRAADHRDALD